MAEKSELYVIRRLRTSAKKRYKRRLKLFQRQYAEWEITFDRIKQSLASYRGHLKHGHTWKLNKKLYRNLVFVRHRPEEEDKLEHREPGWMGFRGVLRDHK